VCQGGQGGQGGLCVCQDRDKDLSIHQKDGMGAHTCREGQTWLAGQRAKMAVIMAVLAHVPARLSLMLSQGSGERARDVGIKE
jgi:hypothetical protein